jgi:hypothetical protein
LWRKPESPETERACLACITSLASVAATTLFTLGLQWGGNNRDVAMRCYGSGLAA